MTPYINALGEGVHRGVSVYNTQIAAAQNTNDYKVLSGSGFDGSVNSLTEKRRKN